MDVLNIIFSFSNLTYITYKLVRKSNLEFWTDLDFLYSYNINLLHRYLFAYYYSLLLQLIACNYVVKKLASVFEFLNFNV